MTTFIDDNVYGTQNGLVSGGDAGNSLSSAETFILDSDGTATIVGSTGDGSDSNDYYKFTAAGDGTATFELTGLSDSLYLRLYDSNGSQLTISPNGNTTNDKTLSYNLTSGESYYVRVDPFGSAESNYNLDITSPVTTSTTFIDDNVYGTQNGLVSGGDAGNSLSSAETFILDSDGTATIVGSTGDGSDSNDYYKFTAAGDGTATFELTGLSDSLYLRLYDSNGSQLTISPNGNTTNDKTLSYNLTSGESYYVRVDPFGSAESNYNLDITSPVTTSTTFIDDNVYGTQNGLVSGGDAGNSLSSAETFILDSDGTATIVGSTGDGSDSNDYYKFTAAGDGTATFELTGLSDSLYLRLYDSNGSQLTISPNGNTTNDKTLSYNLTSGESYYVRVDPFGSAESNYNLDITSPVTTSTTFIDDNVYGTQNGLVSGGDAGNSLSSAETFILDSDGTATIVGSTGDGSDSNDYYKFTAAGDGTATFELTGLSDSLYLRLYDSNGSQLTISPNGNTTNDKTLSYNLTSGESYYVRVDPFGSAESNYNLDITSPVTTSTTFIDDNVYGTQNGLVSGGDAGNSLSSAETFILDSDGTATIVGSTGDGSDSNDYYKFTAAGDGTATFELTGLSDSLYLRLYDSNGSQLTISPNGNTTNDKTLSYNLTSGESYYVRVDPFGSAESNYNLDITSPVTTSSGGDEINLSLGPNSIDSQVQLSTSNVNVAPLTWAEAADVISQNTNVFDSLAYSSMTDLISRVTGTLSFMSLLGMISMGPIAIVPLGVLGFASSVGSTFLGTGLDLGGDTDLLVGIIETSSNHYYLTGTIFPGQDPAYIKEMIIDYDPWGVGHDQLSFTMPAWQSDPSSDYCLPDESSTAESNYAPYTVMVDLNFTAYDTGYSYDLDEISLGFSTSDGGIELIGLNEISDFMVA